MLVLRFILGPVFGGITAYTILKKRGGHFNAFIAYLGIGAPFITWGIALLGNYLEKYKTFNPETTPGAYMTLTSPLLFIWLLYPLLFMIATILWGWREPQSKWAIIFGGILATIILIKDVLLLLPIALSLSGLPLSPETLLALTWYNILAVKTHFQLGVLSLPGYVAFGLWLARKFKKAWKQS
ncbi:MAG: hypothetical protein NDF55_08940 [archaeon GB-1867-005]|nr:hypothetical protein [Candidatus Culexmicrobium cathedralense]